MIPAPDSSEPIRNVSKHASQINHRELSVAHDPRDLPAFNGRVPDRETMLKITNISQHTSGSQEREKRGIIAAARKPPRNKTVEDCIVGFRDSRVAHTTNLDQSLCDSAPHKF